MVATHEEAAALVRLAQEDLAAYCVAASGPEYQLARHIRLLIEHLEALERDDIRQLIVELPPQNSKSTHMSQLYPAWHLGRNPRSRVALGSYGQEIASRNGRRVRQLLTSDLWPFNVGIAMESRAAHRWNTSHGGGLIAVGVGGALTGNPADMISVDDPIKDRQDADSPLIRDRAWEWWTDVVWTRRSPRCKVLQGGTRWHDDDLTGRILNSAGASDWTVLSLPAIAGEDDPLGRAPGEPLWPERYPLAFLEAARETMSARSWAALYQQNPVPEGGNIIQAEWIQPWLVLPPHRRDEQGKPVPTSWRVVLTVDTSWDEGVGHDPSAIAAWGTDGTDYFLLHYWSRTVEFPDLRAQVRSIFTRLWRELGWRPSYIFVEDKANGRPLIQELRRTRIDEQHPEAGLLPVVPLDPRGSKIARLEATTPLFQGGHVFVDPNGGDVLEAWRTELLRFPFAPHDEAADTTSMALLALNPHLAAGVLTIEFGGQPQGELSGAARRLQALDQRKKEQAATERLLRGSTWRPRQGEAAGPRGPSRVR